MGHVLLRNVGFCHLDADRPMKNIPTLGFMLILVTMSNLAYADVCHVSGAGRLENSVLERYFTSQSAALSACESASNPFGQSGCYVSRSREYICNGGGSDSSKFTFQWDWGATTPPLADGWEDDGNGNWFIPVPVIECDRQSSIALVDDLGVTTACEVNALPTPEGVCDSILGRQNNVDLCGDHQDTCFGAGGTFGFAGTGTEMSEICLASGSSIPVPTCASGSYIYVQRGDGDATQNQVACAQPDELPVTICDGSTQDCDRDGKVDDQNKNGLVDNGVADTGGAGTASGPTAGTGTRNIGDLDFETPTIGEGQCDPTSTNYAECIGQGDAGELTLQSSGGTFDSVNASMGARISASGFGGMASNITGVFSGAGACPAPSFSAFGTSFAINFHCTLYSSISGILSAVMLVVFSMAGIRHMMSA
jgi:hypothetical protein